jgi:hypothetical protein
LLLLLLLLVLMDLDRVGEDADSDIEDDGVLLTDIILNLEKV